MIFLLLNLGTQVSKTSAISTAGSYVSSTYSAVKINLLHKLTTAWVITCFLIVATQVTVTGYFQIGLFIST